MQVDPASIIPSMSQAEWADDVEGVVQPDQLESKTPVAELTSSKTLMNVNETKAEEGFKKPYRGRGRGRGGYYRNQRKEGEDGKPRERREFNGEKREYQKGEEGQQQRQRRPYKPRPAGEKRERPQTAVEA